MSMLYTFVTYNNFDALTLDQQSKFSKVYVYGVGLRLTSRPRSSSYDTFFHSSRHIQ